MEGVNLTLGRYMTPVGAESFFVNENINVTRGLLWTIQPVNHTGGYIGGACECGLSWQLGASNGYGNTMADTDTEPTFVGSVGYKMDTLGFKLNGVYGGNIDDLLGGLTTFGLVGNSPFSTPTAPSVATFGTGFERNNDKIGLLDAVLTWNPSEALTTWLNFDYWWTQNKGSGTNTSNLGALNIWGIAGAGRYAITEATGFALRYEYLQFFNSGDTDADLMEVTATLDHHLTDHLVLSAEGRWDRGRADGAADTIYLANTTGGSAAVGSGITLGDFLADEANHQVLGLVQLRYDF